MEQHSPKPAQKKKFPNALVIVFGIMILAVVLTWLVPAGQYKMCIRDRVIVLNDGQIDDFGTPAELMERNQIYREVYQQQQKGARE